MPIEIDLDNTDDLKAAIENIVDSTIIRLNGKGAIMLVQN
jgi:hypothetical protein